ncbi:MAG: MgtC/SapB family protein [Ktedonobacteraceae bacterium]
MNILDFILRLVVALICGSLIGVERQYRQRTAGLRTIALVASGSALFVLVAALTPGEPNPTLIAAQVVSGVGFLCAGVIIRDGLNVRGLNTAGTLWCASGVGVLAGSGYFLPALAGSIVILIGNLLLRPVANVITRHSRHSEDTAETPVHYIVRITCLSQKENHIRSLLLHSVSASELSLRALQSTDTANVDHIEVLADLQLDGRKDALLEQVVGRLSLEKSVSSVRWEVVSHEQAAGMTLFGGKQSEQEAEI